MNIETFMTKYFKEYETTIPLARQDKLYRLKRQTIVKEVDLDEENVNITGFEPEGNFSERITEKDDRSE